MPNANLYLRVEVVQPLKKYCLKNKLSRSTAINNILEAFLFKEGFLDA